MARAEATDADDPETDNAALRFSILDQDSPEFFSIDEHTGEIRTVHVGLDREVRLLQGQRRAWGLVLHIQALHRAGPSCSADTVAIMLTLVLPCWCEPMEDTPEASCSSALGTPAP